MRTFILRFEADSTGVAKSIEFAGLDAHRAFAILASEPERRRATVWEGTRCLGSVLRTGKGSWELGRTGKPNGRGPAVQDRVVPAVPQRIETRE